MATGGLKTEGLEMPQGLQCLTCNLNGQSISHHHMHDATQTLRFQAKSLRHLKVVRAQKYQLIAASVARLNTEHHSASKHTQYKKTCS